MYEGNDQPETSLSASKRGVDMKMIDFAHSSLPHISSYGSGSVRHKGPDMGYLFGLDNLIRLLEELLAAATSLSLPSVTTTVPV